MGDLRAWSPEPNGAVSEEKPFAVAEDYWRIAEAATQEIIEKVQPTAVSEDRRRAVIDYVHRLIRNSTCCQVLPFGSVPLKTYLPDGDIDLTAISTMNVSEETLSNDVHSVLEREDHNCAAEFVVKDVQLIRAEVKLVKCLVQNIVVDISFNQLGGLSTLCFLEKVALLIGKDHLFKRSIILIKAWCYYESRILGAHHGLISTYALETLVLYIFHLFHSSLNGPLAVLYKFLDYFSNFDWDNYCISLNGPVRIASLPEVVVETPENGGCDMLLSDDFFKECLEMFSVPVREFETNSRTFLLKHLNIVDPLKENNNLGRSVSKGNFCRIRSAFTFGARKLARILSLPEESVAGELCKFFSNTLDRHGSGQRPDVQDPVPIDQLYGLGATSSFSGRESNHEDEVIYESESANFSGGIQEYADFNAKKSANELNFTRVANEEPNTAKGIAVSENRLNGDALDLATSGVQGLSISHDALKSCSSSVEPSKSSTNKAYYVPHLYSHSTLEQGELGVGSPKWKQPKGSGFTEKRFSSGVLPAPGEEITHAVCTDLDDNNLVANQELLSSVSSKNHQCYFSSFSHSSEDFYHGNHALASVARSPEAFNSLADLSGDYDSHLSNLHHYRCLYEHVMKTPASSMPPLFFSQFQNNGSWDVTRQSVQFEFRRNPIALGDGNVIPRSMFYVNPPLPSRAAFGMEEIPKPRGTGTYFPNANHYKDRTPPARPRNQALVRSPRSNGRNIASPETSLPERNNCELSQSQVPTQRNGGKSGSCDLRQSGSHVNGTVHSPERVVEFGSVGHLALGTVSLDTGRQSIPGSGPAQSSSVSLPTWGTLRPKPASSREQDRIDVQSYELKDEEDFPPLSDSSGKGLAINTVKSNTS